MSDANSSSAKNNSDSTASEENDATSEKTPKGGPKKKQPITLHPTQEKAIRYTSFMLAEEGKPLTADEFIKEAIGRHLTYVQKHGVEFPPKMLAELTRLHLIK